MAEEEDAPEIRVQGYRESEPVDLDPATPIGMATIQRLVWELMSRTNGSLIVVEPRECDAGKPGAFHSWAWGDPESVVMMAAVAHMEVERRMTEGVDESQPDA